MIDYVLVPDIMPGEEIIYYAGYYQITAHGNNVYCFPVNVLSYDKAMKISRKYEAQEICNRVNKSITPKGLAPFTYHVEEHAYIQ